MYVSTLKNKLAVEDFRIIGEIGEGSFSKVFVVEKKESKEILAMKKVRKDDVIKRNSIEKLMEERNILSKLRHPFIIKFHASFQDDLNLFFIFEFAQGGDLFFHIFRKPDFENYYGFREERAKFYAAEIFLALQFLHSKNILFRDLKPENVLLDSEGHIKLCDLGISKELKRSENYLTSSFVGTTKYMAPEILGNYASNTTESTTHNYRNGNCYFYSKSVDWWSFGILVYILVFGMNPYEKMYLEYIEHHKILELQKLFHEEGKIDQSLLFSIIIHEDIFFPFNSIDINQELDPYIIFQNQKNNINSSNSKVRIVSNEAKDFLFRLLQKDVRKRLGYYDDREIMNHPFFRNSIDFEKLKKKLVSPPFVPQLLVAKNNDRIDLKYFENVILKNSLEEKKIRKVSKSMMISKEIHRYQFQGFSFCRDSFVDREVEEEEEDNNDHKNDQKIRKRESEKAEEEEEVLDKVREKINNFEKLKDDKMKDKKMETNKKKKLNILKKGVRRFENPRKFRFRGKSTESPDRLTRTKE